MKIGVSNERLVLVTDRGLVDVAVSDREDIHLWCEIDGVRVQDGKTSDFIFSIPQIIEYLSSVVELIPGDVILTGTPSGVGAGMEPPRFLVPDSMVTTGMDVVGEMRHQAIAVDPWEWRA
jgi:2,4-didehydro-3-deoxy-L-rhamnonate hydrolase